MGSSLTIGNQIFRFPQLLTDFNNLVNVESSFYDFIHNEKFTWIRWMKKYVINTKHQELWRTTLRTISFAVYEFYKTHPELNGNGQIQLHFTVWIGDLDIFQDIFATVQDKNPKAGWSGTTPLHLAATYGHLEMYQLIIGNVEDKNPKHDDEGDTPKNIADQPNE